MPPSSHSHVKAEVEGPLSLRNRRVRKRSTRLSRPLHQRIFLQDSSELGSAVLGRSPLQARSGCIVPRANALAKPLLSSTASPQLQKSSEIGRNLRPGIAQGFS